MTRIGRAMGVGALAVLLGGVLAAQTNPVEVLAYVQPGSGITDVT